MFTRRVFWVFSWLCAIGSFALLHATLRSLAPWYAQLGANLPLLTEMVWYMFSSPAGTTACAALFGGLLYSIDVFAVRLHPHHKPAYASVALVVLQANFLCIQVAMAALILPFAVIQP